MINDQVFKVTYKDLYRIVELKLDFYMDPHFYIKDNIKMQLPWKIIPNYLINKIVGRGFIRRGRRIHFINLKARESRN
jgi:hypothetical protein